MDVTMQSYLNEAVFSSGRGQEATFVSYLQKDSQESKDSASRKSLPEDLLRKSSFISYIDDESDPETNYEDFAIGNYSHQHLPGDETFQERPPKTPNSRSSTPSGSVPASTSNASWRRLNFRRLKSLRAKTLNASCEEELVTSPTQENCDGPNEIGSPLTMRRKMSFRHIWRSRNKIEGPVLRRSQSAKEVRGHGLMDLSQPQKSRLGLLPGENVLSSKGNLNGQKKVGSSSNLFRTFGLKRTQTLSSIVATWNKSIRISKRKSQSFRHLENITFSMDCRRPPNPTSGRLSTVDIPTYVSPSGKPPTSNQGKFRARGLSNIDPKFTSQSGLCSSSQVETSRGSIRIHHLTGNMSGGLPPGIGSQLGLSKATSASSLNKDVPRFPRLEDCAHFHYEYTELGPIQLEILDEEDEVKPLICYGENNSNTKDFFSLQVTSLAKSWVIKRSFQNFVFLDKQIHQCVFDRKLSSLPELDGSQTNKGLVRQLLSVYVERFSSIAGSVITCGPVLNWLELDNRGHRLIVSEDGAINRPAVAAAYAVKGYSKQATDEISFEVGDMISVIDMPPPDESIWWRGKRGFEVGFFPCECVEVIGDKLPQGLNLPMGSTTTTTTASSGERKIPLLNNEDDEADGCDSPNSEPTKPVLRKHGKLISFFRSFILSRPTRGKLKKSGILKERVFGCDLSEHLLNTGQDVPSVLIHCAEFIETAGMIDGIYRLSGIASNIQKLRVAFDEDRVPNLYQDKGVLQDVHSVSSLLKMYFRELPNPLCTYYLYDQFVEAAKSAENERLIMMRDVVQKLPPPNYRTLEYLSRHLYRVSLRGHETGMTAKNVAIVWAPNLLRSKSLEGGGVAALQGVGVQAVVTECLIRYCELIFSDKMPAYNNGRASTSPPPAPPMMSEPKKLRPKSLAISTPTKLLTLEEARNRALAQAAANLGSTGLANVSHSLEHQKYIEVGGGPENLPSKYHTVIDLPNRKPGGSMKHHRKSPIGWKAIFTGVKPKQKPIPKISSPAAIDLLTVANNSKLMLDLEMKGLNRQILRPVKSAESLIMLQKREQAACQQELNGGSTSRPISGDSDDLAPLETVTKAVGSIGRRRGGSHKGHERSNSHDSYFERAKREAEAAEAAAKADSSLDLSDLQVNFDLEETEMNIFTEDMLSNSLGSDISKSPLEDNKQQSQQPQQVELRNLAPKKSPRMSTESNEGGEDSPKSRSKMSFREKLKRFTSPTPSRVRRDSEEGGSDGEIIKTHPDQVRRPSSSIRDKLVCALSPESLRRRHTTTIEASPATSSEREIQTTGDTSPKKKKSAFSPGTSPSANLVKRSKIEEEQSRQVPHSDVATINHSDVATINQNDVAEIVVAVATNDVATIPLSPSMKFIDSSMHESTDSTAARLLTTGESGGKHDNSHRFSTTSSTDDEGVLLDQLVVAQVHHNPILESQHEEEEDQESDDLDAKILHNVPIETDSTSFNQVAPMQKKLSVTSQLSGEQTPSEFSVSFAGATVSENESFSILSVDEDHMMIPICQEIDSIYPVVQQPSQHIVPEMEQENLQTVGGGNVKELFDRLDDEVIEGVEAMEVDEYKFVESKLLQSLESVEHMEVDETNTNKNRFDYRPLTTKESSADSSISDENDRSCKRRSESSDSAASSSASDPSDVPTAVKLDNVDEDRLPTHVASTVFYTKQTSRFTLQVNEDNSKPDIQKPVQLLPSAHPCKSPREEGEPQAAAKQDLTFRTYGPKPYTKKETFQPAVQMETEDCIVDIKRSHGGLRSRFPQTISEVEKPQQDFSATSRNDNSHNKFKQDNSFVNKSRQEENLFSEKSTLDNSFIDKSKSDALVLDKSKPDTLLFDKSHADKFKPDTLVLDKSKPDTLLFDKSHEDIMEDENEAEAKSFSLPHIQASEMEVDGRKSAQGIPEIEKKLSFAEPNLTKVPSDGVIAKGKKLSTFSLQSAEEAKQAALVAAEELPLQRRNSIHNVPYVDVNDPATRERMERYKEERRSMLRAKYRVEDYREKPPSGKSSETKKPGEETSPIRKMSESSEKQSPDLSRYRKVSTTSNDKSHATADDKGDRKVSMATSNDKSHATADDKVDRKVSMTTSNDKSHGTADDKGDRKASMITSNDKSQLTTAATVPDKVKPVDPPELTPSTGLRKLPMEKSPVNTKSAASYLVDNFTKQVDTAETPMRKWTSTSRTSLTSFENKKVSVSIIEPEVTLRKVTTATPTTTVLPVQKIATPIISPASPATLPFNQENVYTAKTTVLQRQKLNSRSSLPTGGLVEDDVNVRERAAIFNSAAAHRANQAELRTKFVSLTPPSKESKNSNRKIGGPGSPSKIKNIAAMFEQKT